jgi:DNA-binding transcriptional ArsR family regulator
VRAPAVSERRDERDDDDEPGVDHETGDLCDPTDVLHPVDVGFTVLMSRNPSVTTVGRPPEGSSAQRVLAALGNHAVSVSELQRVTGLSPANIRRVLRQLRDQYGLVEQIGGRGRPTTYRRR